MPTHTCAHSPPRLPHSSLSIRTGQCQSFLVRLLLVGMWDSSNFLLEVLALESLCCGFVRVGPQKFHHPFSLVRPLLAPPTTRVFAGPRSLGMPGCGLWLLCETWVSDHLTTRAGAPRPFWLQLMESQLKLAQLKPGGHCPPAQGLAVCRDAPSFRLSEFLSLLGSASPCMLAPFSACAPPHGRGMS